MTPMDKMRIDSRDLSAPLDARHRAILELIDRYAEQLDRMGSLIFESQRGAPLEHGGFAKPTRYAMLNEDQCMFILAASRNNDKVAQAKHILSMRFAKTRAALVVPAIGREV